MSHARALDAAFKRAEGQIIQASAERQRRAFSVVDREGNLCAVTQTLLSMFGSRVVSPSTGLLMNNGIMWFDPEPGKANSLGPNKRCLGNYCPVVGETEDGRHFALGASGGRKIIGTVLQIGSFLMDYRMSLEDAFHQPRIDMSGAGCDRGHGAARYVLDALAASYTTVTPSHDVSRSRSLRACCATASSAWDAPKSCRRGAMRSPSGR
jgi:gamma-glutamyltranspeptidase/glutathione hydrolase